MDTYSLVTLLRPLVPFSSKEKDALDERFSSLSLSLDDRKTPLPSNFSIKHSRDAKFGREEILARVSSAPASSPASSPTCRFLFIRPGESPAGARLCWLQKKERKKKNVRGLRYHVYLVREINFII